MNKIIAMMAATFLLAGCTASKPSPERHIIAFTENRPSSLDGNLRYSSSATYRNLLPLFEQAYQKGKTDRLTGRNVAYAINFSTVIKNNVQRNAEVKYTVPGKPEKADPQVASLLGDELAATYLDGYNGVN